MRDETIVALAKIFKAKAEGITLPPGKVSVNETLEMTVQGQLSVGKDYLTTPTVNIPWKMTVALLLSKLPFWSRKKVQTALTEAIVEAMDAGDDVGESIGEIINDIDKALNRVKEVTGQLPKVPRKGQIRGEVVLVQQPELVS